MLNFFFFLDTSAIEDQTIAFYRNVWNQSSSDATSYRRENECFSYTVAKSLKLAKLHN
jgi:hypothetical protein